MARNKGLEMIMRIKADLDKTLPGKLGELAKELSSLSKKQANLNRVAKMYPKNSNLAKNTKEYNTMKEKLKALDLIKNSDVKLTKEQEKEYKTLIRASDKLGKKINKERAAFQKYGMELKKLKIPHDQLQNEIKQTGLALDKLTAKQKIYNKVSNLKNKTKAIGKKALSYGKTAAIGAGVAGITAAGTVGISSANAYIDFNKQMKRVQAISGATKEDFKILENAAKNFGATTSFTAFESAAAMEKMALAGFKPKEILAGMPGVLNLAAASGEDLAMVSDIITDNLTAFGMTAKDTSRFADVLAYSMSTTNVNVESLGEAFKFVSGNAGGLGVSLEETSAAIGLMGDQAIKSGMAGRGLDATFSQLIKNSGELKNIGINLKDSKGNFVGLTNTVKQFETYINKSGMDAMQKQEFLLNVFGKQGARAFGRLLSAKKEIDGVVYSGSEAVEKYVEATENKSVGSAEKMKEIMLEGAGGAWTLFTSAIDGLKIAIGGNILSQGTLKQVKILTDYISELANVLNGVHSSNKINIFWTNVINRVKEMYNEIKINLMPGINALISIITSPSLLGFFNDFTNILWNIGLIGATVFSKLAQGLKWINDNLGIGNLLTFLTIFFSIRKGISLFFKLKSQILDTVSIIKNAGGLVTYITTFINPVNLIIAAVILLGFVIYKNWDSIKKILIKIKDYILYVWESIKQVISIVGELFLKFTLLGQIISLCKLFFDTWDSSRSILDNIKNIFNMLFTLMKEKINIVIDIVSNLWNIFLSVGSSITSLFIEFTPLGTIIALCEKFYNTWDSSKSLIDNFKNIFKALFDFIPERIDIVIEKFNLLKDTIKNLPLIKRFFKDDATNINLANENKVDGSHRNGLSYVPKDGYIAELHRGERVLTSSENNEYNYFNNSENKGLLDRFIPNTPRTENNNTNNQNTNSKIELNYNPTYHIETKNNISEIMAEFDRKQQEEREKILKMIQEVAENDERTSF
ncbi:MAG: phage tail tape measure protein [Cetobacterium sp.]|uniref:phage tail tape measure protein n=1 Tax=Cetobacterium sp. TaxID=2071632 RepID=UPI003F3A61D1